MDRLFPSAFGIFVFNRSNVPHTLLTGTSWGCEDPINLQKIIDVSCDAVNACTAVNPEHPELVANNIVAMVEILKSIVSDGSKNIESYDGIRPYLGANSFRMLIEKPDFYSTRWEYKMPNSKIHPDKKYDSKIPLSCFLCGKNTSNRVETDVDLGALLGEESRPLWAPICDDCLKVEIDSRNLTS